MTDKYLLAKFSKEMWHNPYNELTMTCTSNDYLNIDFITLSKANEQVLENKNVLFPDEIKVENFQQFNEDMIKGIFTTYYISLYYQYFIAFKMNEQHFFF